MIDFSRKATRKSSEKKIDPKEIYEGLDRTSTTGPLRPTQERVLKSWYSDRRQDKDLIIKLHTGAGKTLVGLLIALSYLNSCEGPCVYVCPNIYLMKQVCAEAKKFGIPFCFIDPQYNNDIPSEFTDGKAVLITYVQKVFNGLSIFGIGNRSVQVGCLIMDDSHACIDSIHQACTIRVTSQSNAFRTLTSIFESYWRQQREGSYEDYLNGDPNVILPIPYWAWQDHITEVTSCLAKAQSNDNNIKFAWPLLKDYLVDCSAYLGGSEIEITPLCLPIQQFGIFNKAKHRILMSATTQEDTLFIKGLGLSAQAVKTPLIDSEYVWSGEKMILIPELICDSTKVEDIIGAICGRPHEYGIAVLTASMEKAKKYEHCGAELMNGSSDENKKMYQHIVNFKNNHRNKTIVFANRYDGIDLPDDCCRILMMDSVPYYNSLSDRYEELCRSGSEIVRIKTVQKIEQGLGRSVRGEKDYSVVLIFGRDLIKYLRSTENRRLFSAQTQKQIEIGFNIVDMAKEDDQESNKIQLLFKTIRQCLERDVGWKDYYTAEMDSLSSTSSTKTDLYAILQKEREAYLSALDGNFLKACNLLREISDKCANEEDKGWYLQLQAQYCYQRSKQEAHELQAAAFQRNHQLLKPVDGVSYKKLLSSMDDTRVRNILTYIGQYTDYEQLNLNVEELLSNFSFGVSSEKFESSVDKIGKLLGCDTQRPDLEIGKGSDNLWCVGKGQYVLIECKSEVSQTRESITKREAGQIVQHCAWFHAEYTASNISNVLIIPSALLAGDAYFPPDYHIRILDKKGLEDFKNTVRNFIREFQKYALKGITSDTLHRFLSTHNLDSSTFIERFLKEPKSKR